MTAWRAIERFFQSAKYEHLYPHHIDDGQALAEQIAGYLTVYNEIRPHEALDFKRPIERYHAHRRSRSSQRSRSAHAQDRPSVPQLPTRQTVAIP